MAPSIPISIPFKGLNTLNPFIDWDSTFARELTNYSVFNGSLQMRPGIEVLTESQAAGAISRTYWFDSAVNQSIIANGDFVNTATRAVIGNIGGAPQALATRVKHISVDLVIGLRQPRSPVSPFTNWTFTTNTITATAITSAVSHKGRLLVCDGDTIEFSPVGNITGNMSSLPGGGAFPISYLMDGQKVLRMFSNSIGGNTADSVLIIFGDGGKVLVYQGSYPGSADFQIVGNYSMPAPVSNVSFVDIDGDIFIVTNRYGYWFSALFSGGVQSAYGDSPTRPIENIWQLVNWNSTRFNLNQNGPFCFYYAPLDCIVVATNTGLTDPNFDLNTKIAFYQNETIYFVYFRKYNAWGVWLNTALKYPVIPNAISGVIEAVSDTGSIVKYNENRVFDEYHYQNTGLRYLPITTSWKTPYYYPQSGKTRNVAGVQPFYRNVENGDFNLIRVIFDQSDMNAPFGFYSQPTAVSPVLPGRFTFGNISVAPQSTNVYREFCGVGGEGACFSVQFTQQPNGLDEDASLQMQLYLASMSFTEGANYPA